MKILVLEHEYDRPLPKEYDQLLAAEARAVWRLQQDNILREIYFTTETHEAVLILECSSQEDAQARLNEFPLVKAGCIRFEIIALEPYSGLARLFQQD